MIRRSLRMLIGIATVASLLFAQNSVSAQTPSQAITVSPASTRISVDAGSSISKTFEIINGGKSDLSVALSVSPYHVTGEHYDPEFTQLPGTVDASEWVTLDQKSATIAGEKVLTVKYTVTAPAGTAPGGYYAVIFSNTTQEGTNTNGIVPQSRVGSILYITVNGDIKTSGNVTANPIPSFSFSPSIPLGVKVSNDGGVHFESKVTFKVTDLTGREVFKQELERIILPSTIRDISTNWESSAPFGIYTVERQATVGDKTITLESHKVVIASPWFLTCVIIFLGSITTLFILQSRQRKKRK